jgi:hypothetical protein
MKFPDTGLSHLLSLLSHLKKRKKWKQNLHLVNIPQNVEPNEDYIIAEPK